MNAQLSAIEQLFQALGDATRLRILGLLLTGEVCVCHVHQSLGVSQPKASRHLAYLRRAGLVETRRHGQWVYYRLADTGDAVLKTIRQSVEHALGHLEAVQRDAGRLSRKTGCCLPDQPAPSCVCCGMDQVAAGSGRAVQKRDTPLKTARRTHGTI